MPWKIPLGRLGTLLPAHRHLEPAHDRLLHRLVRTGEEAPHPRAGSVEPRVRGEALGRVVGGVDAEGDEVEDGSELPGPPLDLRHPGGDGRADRRAAREDEARDPGATLEILGPERAAVLIGELERREGGEHRKGRWNLGPQRPDDRPRRRRRDDQHPEKGACYQRSGQPRDPGSPVDRPFRVRAHVPRIGACLRPRNVHAPRWALTQRADTQNSRGRSLARAAAVAVLTAVKILHQEDAA